MAEPKGWDVRRIEKRHDRGHFECGIPELDVFLKRFARQNDAKGIGRTYCATRPGEWRVLGFFTLRSGAVAFEQLPAKERKKVPRYPVPVAHLGRLAVDRTAQGQGLGEALLVAALRRAQAAAAELGVYAVEVVAKDERARRFYQRYGFRSLEDDRLHMYLSMNVVERALAEAG